MPFGGDFWHFGPNGCNLHPHRLVWQSMPRVIQIRDVPDEVHDALVGAAQAQGLSLTKYLVLELTHLAEREQVVRHNAGVVRDTQSRVRGHVPRKAILAALHQGRDD
jgi:hypothetical protein